MPPGRDWTEERLSETPAIAHLQRLGYTFAAPETLEAERDSLKEAVLTKRLAAALKKLNPWLSDNNVHKAVRAVTTIQATSAIEASREVYTTLTHGKAFEQDRGDGKKSHDVRYFDFDRPENNDFVATRQFRVQGAKLKLRRDATHDNPTIVIVTDRVDLDEQISGTFVNCGFANPERAESVKDLRALLSGPTGKTVMTTIQKFQEASSAPTDKNRRAPETEHPVLSTASNVFVLVDEAHRTQYRGLAANLRLALPNACFFGFTGTPIDKKDRSTLHTFGPYIDQYTIEQAVRDGATVPIFYEGRLPELRILGNTLDAIFDRVFADRSDEDPRTIRSRSWSSATCCSPGSTRRSSR